MIKLKSFFKILMEKIKQNELFVMSNAMTYKLLLAIFPFLIFLMTLLGFFNVGIEDFLIEISQAFPKEVREIFSVFLSEVVYNKNLKLMSSSLFVSLISASFGFYGLIKCFNKAFELKETRSFLKVRVLSVFLVIIYAFMMTLFLILFIFGDSIINMLGKLDFLIFFKSFQTIYLEIFTTGILFIMLSVIYKVSISKKVTFKSTFPGTLFTISGWIIASKVFNIYVNNFSKYSKIYGSIGSLFILIVWINIFSFILLVGGQINAILDKNLNLLKK